MLDTLRRLLFIGVGTAALAAEKLEELMADLVERGELTEREARQMAAEWLQELRARQAEIDEQLERRVRLTIERHELASLRELRALETKVERLEQRLRDFTSLEA
jgi:polyhydroxyalkanoate synthesis regulator phasin